MEKGNTMQVKGNFSLPLDRDYTISDRVVQIANYARMYDAVKYYDDKKAMGDLITLQSIFDMHPEGEKIRRLIEYDVDMKYGAVPKRKVVSSEDIARKYWKGAKEYE
jgi:hypothetical protein